MKTLRPTLLLACAVLGATFATASYADRDNRDWDRGGRHEFRHDRFDRFDRHDWRHRGERRGGFRHGHRYLVERPVVYVQPAPVFFPAPVIRQPPPGIWISTPDIFIPF